MHPINKRNFGPAAGKLAVKFYDGSTVVTGWIVKQTGSRRYIVSNGTVTKTCHLAQTTTQLTALTAGTGADAAKRPTLCTIEVAIFGGSTENVKKMLSTQILTVQGKQVSYKLGVAANANGKGTLAVVANAAPTVANLIPDRTATVAAAWTYTVPANTFADLNGDKLTYTATKGDNTALPAWIVFNAATRVFTKAAGAGSIGTVTIKVTASDGTANVSDSFDLVVS